MSTSRHRVRSGAVVEGYRFSSSRSGNWVEKINSTRRFQPLSQTMNDIVGDRFSDNPANSTKTTRKGGTVSGLDYYGSTGQFRHRYENYSWWNLPLAVNHLPLSGKPGILSAAVTGAAMGNPSRPSVQLPVSIAELREIPSMVLSKLPKGLSKLRDIPDAVADGYLTYAFGVAPTVSDIVKLFDFPSKMESRIATLNLLSKGKRIRRRRRVWEDSQTVMGNEEQLHIGQSTRLYGTRKTETSGHCVVTARWEPSEGLKNIGDPQMAELARNLVLGLSPQTLLSNAWEILPWSWLIDWFSNLGDFLSLSNNVVARLSGPCCVTYVTETTITYTGLRWTASPQPLTSMSSTALNARRFDWERHITAPLFPSFNVPILSGHQTSILGALATKFR